MEYIGERISIKQKENELSIVILSFKNKTKNILLLSWLILWSLSGLLVIFQYSSILDQNTKAAIIVWMGFWAYFEYIIARSFLWRKSGKEIIKLRGNKIFYKRHIGRKSKIKVYEYEFIKDFKIIDARENSFFENLNNSYWVIAGEKLVFDYYGKEIKIGIQLPDADAELLKKRIEKEIKKVLI